MKLEVDDVHHIIDGTGNGLQNRTTPYQVVTCYRFLTKELESL
jgi:hypothetical protein